MPVASIALDLSSPFAISSRVAKTESNVLHTASTATYLQDQRVSESLCNCLCGLFGCNSDCFWRKIAWVTLRDKKTVEGFHEREEIRCFRYTFCTVYKNQIETVSVAVHISSMGTTSHIFCCTPAQRPLMTDAPSYP